MFKQINIPIKIPNIPVGIKLVQNSGSHDRHKFLYTEKLDDINIASISLYSCGKEFDEIFLSQLPKKLLDIEVPSVYFMTISKENKNANYLPIHIDKGRRCALNFYTKCNDEITEFYNEDGKFLNSFIAKKDSVWLLDVSKPHSVKFNSNSKRNGITLSFKHKNYERIENSLKEYIKC